MNPQNFSATSTAILAVSFGTAVSETRTNTLEAIEHAIQTAYPHFKHYRAWTSTILREKVLSQDGLKINSLAEAFEQMKQDGIQKVIVQPTLISDGREYQKIKQELTDYQCLQNPAIMAPSCLSVTLGPPLLHRDCDISSIVSAVMNDFQNIQNNELLVFMGHGTVDHDDSFYVNLNSAFHQNGHSNVYIKAMNSGSAISEIVSMAQIQQISKIILAPFMITAGHHALKDMAGEHEQSWRSQLEHAGFSVECILKGLGQNPVIQNSFVKNISSIKTPVL